MKHKTTEFARRLGVTREALRYYEKSGVLLPGRGEENNYRAYSDMDGFEILRIKDLQAHHLTLSDIHTLLESDSLQPHRDRLSAIETELRERISTLNAQLERIQMHRLFVEEAMGESRGVTEMDSYGIYQLMLLGEGISPTEALGEIAEEWIANMPFTEIGWRIAWPEADTPEETMLPAQIGLQAMPHCAFARNLSMEPPVEFSPPAHSVRILVATRDPFSLQAAALRPLTEHIRIYDYMPFGQLCGHYCGVSHDAGGRWYHFTLRALVKRPSGKSKNNA